MGQMQTEQAIALVESTSRAIAENTDKPDYLWQVIVGVTVALIAGLIIYIIRRIRWIHNARRIKRK